MNNKLIFINIVVAVCLSNILLSQVEANNPDTSSKLKVVSNFRPGQFNPTTILEVSNELSSLSKEQIIDTVKTTYSSYQGMSSGYGLFLLLQLVFEIPDSLEYPDLIWGIPNISKPDSSTIQDRFPLLMVEGFPILLPGGYTLNGLPDNLESHIEFYAKYGMVRSNNYDLDCKCDLPQLTTSMRIVWKKYFNDEMDQYEEKRYRRQLKLIVDQAN